MKLVPTNQVEEPCTYMSSTMKSFLMGVGLLAFSVLLSVVDMPLHAAQPHSIESDRIAQQLQLQLQTEQDARSLGKVRRTLRIAAFGSSQMWGAGLENRYDAFPYLISNEVDNYAMFSSGPNYPSVCTETIVGDKNVYDVIFLQYWLKANQGVFELARRLHERFPSAMIFFVKVWSPINFRRRGNKELGEVDMTFEEWRNSKFLPDEQVNFIIQAIEADDGDWYFPERPEADSALNEARKAVDGYHLRIAKKDTAKETLAFYLHFFNHQHAHLSPMGHAYLANITMTTINKKMIMERNEATDDVHPVGDGSWGRGDSCIIWYTTGEYTAETSPGLVMREFDTRKGKYALEVTSPGWFTVTNPFDDERTLYVSFLSTTEGFYPEATVSIGEHGAPMMLVPIDPEVTPGPHDIRTLPIGKIPPGDTKIYVTPQGSTGNYFRLVGVTFTNEIAVPLEYGFGPQINH